MGEQVCIGLTHFDVLNQPGWTDVNNLFFSADGSGLANSLEIANLVLDPVSAVAEPATLTLLGAGLAALGIIRAAAVERRQRLWTLVTDLASALAQ